MVSADDLGKLRRLPPEERIRRLKGLEEERKHDIEEIEDLLKSSERELKTDLLADSIAPERRDVNIAHLFEEDANQLEQVASKESRGSLEERGSAYAVVKQVYQDYRTLKDLAYASMESPLSQSQSQVIDQIGERLDRTKYHSESAEVANILVASRSTLYKIRKYAQLE
jgi:hypothetical protein